jgi:hypothetical protein
MHKTPQMNLIANRKNLPNSTDMTENTPSPNPDAMQQSNPNQANAENDTINH